MDEYGDIKGLITLEQILEEVVGDFTTIVPGVDDDIKPDEDQAYMVRGSTFIRDINRQLGWQLPTESAKTVNGLILDYLEDIPHASTCFKLKEYMIEIVQIRDASVYVAKIKDLSASY